MGVDVGGDSFAGVVESVLDDFHRDAGFERDGRPAVTTEICWVAQARLLPTLLQLDERLGFVNGSLRLEVRVRGVPASAVREVGNMSSVV